MANTNERKMSVDASENTGLVRCGACGEEIMKGMDNCSICGEKFRPWVPPVTQQDEINSLKRQVAKLTKKKPKK